MKAIILVAFLLSGCVGYSGQRAEWEYTPPAESGRIVMVWQFQSEKAIKTICHNDEGMACAVTGKEVCLLTLPRPSDFNDYAKLALIGHEVVHCMGGKHER